jgi:signal transduction histidine kinase
MSVANALLKQSRLAVALEAILLAVLVGVADYLTGSELSFFVFYAAPTAMFAWKFGRRWGTAFAVFCAVVWFAANLSDGLYQTIIGYAVAAFTRVFYLIAVVLASASLKVRRELDRERIATFERTRELEREIVRISESEQQRIGRDLHDGVCQFLAGTAIAAHSLSRKLEAKSSPEASAAREIERLIHDAGRQARSLARAIFPIQMSSEGLAAALDELADFANRTAEGVEVEFVEHGSPAVPNPEYGMHLYRIAQEALSNALRHSKAKRITITLEECDGGLSLSIADDGTGLNAKPGRTDGMGLKTMAYRANAIGGRLEFATAKPHGTLLTCIVPGNARMTEKNRFVNHE